MTPTRAARAARYEPTPAHRADPRAQDERAPHVAGGHAFGVLLLLLAAVLAAGCATAVWAVGTVVPTARDADPWAPSPDGPCAIVDTPDGATVRDPHACSVSLP